MLNCLFSDVASDSLDLSSFASLDSAFAEADRLLEGCADPASPRWQKVNKRLFNGTVVCKTRVEIAGESGSGTDRSFRA